MFTTQIKTSAPKPLEPAAPAPPAALWEDSEDTTSAPHNFPRTSVLIDSRTLIGILQWFANALLVDVLSDLYIGAALGL